ncbi:coiled-coil domain-containing protein 66 isoform X3 [Fukomys damarensis]|uniref:coiled-coil domain-containing protein 66 isoform X3 n=1 Tax=Fukomys damarensis TaxID=885580 RepID=UPI00053FF49E|nr:coiled-coil domain-containing protein 66 isoform X3 [Fukomys damarensis]
MNLGDGLKLETELLDGKTKLILSPYEHKSKISVKMGNKTKIAKCPLRTKQPRNSLKSTQNTFIGSENFFQKKTVGLETSQARGEKSRTTLSPTKDLCNPYTDEDCLLTQKEILPAAPDRQKTRNTTNTSLGTKKKPCNKHITAENVNSSLVCLTQEQLGQILMTVNKGKGFISLTENEKEEEASPDRLHLNSIPGQPKKENIIGLLQKTDAVSCDPNENKPVVNKIQEASKQSQEKIITENEWKPADIFSTLGERERDRSLLEAKKAQWKKDLDEQVALKKKEKEASEKQNNSWKKSENDKMTWEKLLDYFRTSAGSSDVSQSPCQVMVAQADGPSLHKASEFLEASNLGPCDCETCGSTTEGEEHDRWAVHFDSLKSHPGSQSQLSCQSHPTHKQPEYFSVSPDTRELVDVGSVSTPTTGSQREPSEAEQVAKPVRDVAVANGQKTNFLRSMTALLDPAQIEERDRRRQKQLEHQKAITAQVEEKRRRKQLEEEKRKKEEQEEEHRLAREQEEMQKQYEEDILKQKQKEEIMTLKTHELFQTMKRAQELAQRLKQEQRIQELAQKGHDTSRLVKNLGVDKVHVEYNASTNISNSRYDSDEAGGKTNTFISSTTTSPKKDTGVQTDDLNTGIFTHGEPHCGSTIKTEVIYCSSPEISAEFNGQFNNDKQELSEDKGINLEKANSWYDQCSHFITEKKQIKHTKKCPERPDWNINKPLKRYVPASEKYPKQLQKQREEINLRRQVEVLHLVERNNPEHVYQNRSTSPEVLQSSHQENESKIRWQLLKKEEPSLKTHSFSKERFQSSPVPSMKSRTQQTQTTALHLPLKNSSYERECRMLGSSQTELSAGMPELPHFIPYVRTNEIYYLDPDAPLSRPSTEDPQYQNSCDCDQEQQLFNADPVRHRQQAILKGLSELRQYGLEESFYSPL